jgi:hypothetical protein
VLSLFKVLTEVFRSLKTPVVVAFDQLEDLLLARRTDDAHRTAEAFFAGIVQVMHQIDGLCFLIFAERGLWNRFVPSLDGYIQDRLNNPVHVPKHGTVKALRLEAPPADLVQRVVEARLRPCLGELPPGETVPEIFPFTDEQVMRIARTEPTLRDMLQQCRHLFDHIVYGPDDWSQGTEIRSQASGVRSPESGDRSQESGKQEAGSSLTPELPPSRFDVSAEMSTMPATPEAPAPASESEMPATDPTSRIAALLGREEADPQPPIAFKHVEMVETPVESPALIESPPPLPDTQDTPPPLPAMDEVLMAVAVDFVPESGVESQESTERETGSELTPAAKAAPEVPSAVPFPAAVPADVSPAAVVKLLPSTVPVGTSCSAARDGHAALVELWEQEQRAARRKLEPEGALTGATRELQSGLGTFLSLCHEHGVKVGPWRLQHVVNEWSYGEHPTYGVVTIAHWACKGGQPWKVGVGLFLARGAGKPKDLEVKLAVMDTEPAMVDHLILLRPEDDLAVTGKSKTLFQEAERRGKHTRLEPVSLDGFAQMYAFPRWLAAVREALPEGTPLPNLADIIQEKCEKLLEQVCMPVQG